MKTLPYDPDTNTVTVNGVSIQLVPSSINEEVCSIDMDMRRFSHSCWNYLTDVMDANAWPSVHSYAQRFKEGREKF